MKAVSAFISVFFLHLSLHVSLLSYVIDWNILVSPFDFSVGEGMGQRQNSGEKPDCHSQAHIPKALTLIPEGFLSF